MDEGMFAYQKEQHVDQAASVPSALPKRGSICCTAQNSEHWVLVQGQLCCVLYKKVPGTALSWEISLLCVLSDSSGRGGEHLPAGGGAASLLSSAFLEPGCSAAAAHLVSLWISVHGGGKMGARFWLCLSTWAIGSESRISHSHVATLTTPSHFTHAEGICL